MTGNPSAPAAARRPVRYVWQLGTTAPPPAKPRRRWPTGTPKRLLRDARARSWGLRVVFVHDRPAVAGAWKLDVDGMYAVSRAARKRTGSKRSSASREQPTLTACCRWSAASRCRPTRNPADEARFRRLLGSQDGDAIHGKRKVVCAFAGLRLRGSAIPMPFFVKFDGRRKIAPRARNYRQCSAAFRSTRDPTSTTACWLSHSSGVDRRAVR